MDIGMLWFDNDPKADLVAKIDRAATYYRDKYGHAPTLCFVHPSMVNGNPVQHKGVVVRTNGSVMPNHFWLGVNGTS